MATSHSDEPLAGRLVLPDDADDDETAVIIAAIERYLEEIEAARSDDMPVDRWFRKARLESVSRGRFDLPPVLHPDPWLMADRLNR